MHRAEIRGLLAGHRADGMAVAQPEAGRHRASVADLRRRAGETVEAITEGMNVSVATMRRYVTGLALAHEVEEGKHDAAWTKGEKNVTVHRVVAEGAAA